MQNSRFSAHVLTLRPGPASVLRAFASLIGFALALPVWGQGQEPNISEPIVAESAAPTF